MSKHHVQMPKSSGLIHGRVRETLWKTLRTSKQNCWTCPICHVPCESMWYHAPFYWKHCPSLSFRRQATLCFLLQLSQAFQPQKFNSLNVAQQKMMTHDDLDDPQCWSKSGDLISCSPCAVLEPLIPGRSKIFECRATPKDQHLEFPIL